MNPLRACSQSWQVEAIEDGRLGGADQEAFERHVAACTACAAEVRALHELHAHMRAELPIEDSSLAHRRSRAKLLKRANDELLDPPLPRRSRPFLVFAVSAAAILSLAFGLRAWRAPRYASVVAVAPSFDVSEVRPGVWSEERVGTVTHARLSAGAAWFHVEKTSAAQRFLLHLPDGEIEVHGTRFLVDVTAEHTDHVEVSEGVVTLRLAGEVERRLGVGDSWSRPVPVAASPRPTTPVASESRTVPPLPPSIEPPSETAQRKAASRRASRAPSVPRDSNATAAVPARSSEAPAAVPAHSSEAPAAVPARSGDAVPVPARSADVFTSGVEAFQAGDLRSADELLARFVAQSPADSRAEDARFLRILARARRGDRAGASALAEEYLHRHPNGLRRREAEAMILKP